MDFEIDGIKYYICRGFKDGFKTANLIYQKDNLIFIDYIGQDLLQSIAIFKIFKKGEICYLKNI
jgi:hypothetical protein